MTARAYFTGPAGAERAPAHAVAERLRRSHRDLGHDLLFSAAAYLIRSGQEPTEEAVVLEARRRRRRQSGACERGISRLRR